MPAPRSPARIAAAAAAAALAPVPIGCADPAKDPSLGAAKDPAPRTAAAAGPSEPAPVPRIRETRTTRWYVNPGRAQMGWPDRFSGAPAGAPYRPRF